MPENKDDTKSFPFYCGSIYYYELVAASMHSSDISSNHKTIKWEITFLSEVGFKSVGEKTNI